MANNYFKFKQFTVHQDRCAMKVTTIACIQGAWLPNFSPKEILDIGSGTGLLSLMVAQKYSGNIDAVEIEPDAYGQLRENIFQNPWSERINCHHTDIKYFSREAQKKYDFIISNPPFYTEQLQSPDRKINHARHEKGLKIHELAQVVDHLLCVDGMASIMLPQEETLEFINLATEVSLFPSAQLRIADTEMKSTRAVITIFSRKRIEMKTKELHIKNVGGDYSQAFVSLLKAYYLYL